MSAVFIHSFIRYSKLSPVHFQDARKNNFIHFVLDTSLLTNVPRALCKIERVNRIENPVILFIFYFRKETYKNKWPTQCHRGKITNKQTKKAITYEKQIVLEQVESSSTIRQPRLPAPEVLPLSNEAVGSVDPNCVALSVKSNIFPFLPASR